MGRPKNWVEISNKAVVKLKRKGIDFNPASFSAGADAMLEALDKLEVSIKTDMDGRLLVDPGFNCKDWVKGKLVFIEGE